mgnify:FL=1
MSGTKINAMGSEVVEGYACKPKIKDPDKPMMFYRYHILVCDGDRCDCNAKKALSDKLRDLAKELKMDKGADRVKITKTKCFGACRYKGVGLVYENGGTTNNGVWLKKINKWDDEKWRGFFVALKNKDSVRCLYPDDIIAMEEIDG